jgi:hypothetical protein
MQELEASSRGNQWHPLYFTSTLLPASFKKNIFFRNILECNKLFEPDRRAVDGR